MISLKKLLPARTIELGDVIGLVSVSESTVVLST